MRKSEPEQHGARAGRWWLALLAVGVLAGLTGCAGTSAGSRRLVLPHKAQHTQATACFALWTKRDDFQEAQKSAGLEEGECLQSNEALAPQRVLALWQALSRTRTNLNNFAPRRTLAHLLGPMLFETEALPYSELLLRMKPYRGLVVMRPDGYLATALSGDALQKLGEVQVRDGVLMAGHFEVGAFFFNSGGVFYTVDASLQKAFMRGELGLEHDIFNSMLDGAGDALVDVVLAMGQLITEPVRTLEGLKQLPTAVANLIASSPSYFEHYSALPLQEQLREAARISTHVLMLYGSAAGTATRLAAGAGQLSVLSLTADGALALERAALSSTTQAAVLGAGVGAVYVLSVQSKPPEGGGSPAIAKESFTDFKPFTEGNFRENLSWLTGQLPENAHAHHVFPQKLAVDFQKAGIHVHDPRFGAWWEKSSHLKSANA